uniref:8-oxo-dGTP diphosphatase n=1 Tax=Hanusia phi TaxID=3032 RepID=A0A7S0E0I8_9CRYP
MGRIAHLFAAANMIIRQETATTTGGMVAKMKETITDPKKAVNSTKSMILLSRRFNTGFMDGWYGLPAGHVRPTERIHETVMREAKEELGIEVEQGAISVMSTMHRLNKKREYMDFFCIVNSWKGPIVNNEPDKCDDLQFFPVDNLPENTIEHVRQGIQCVFDNIPFSEYGVEGMVKAKD